MISTHGSQVHQDADSFFRDPAQQRSQIVYAKQTRERQVFMEDLREYRRQLEKQAMKTMRKLVGPRWYQVLSVPQRDALDRLASSVYQDLLEGRPTRTSRIIHRLGVFPPPKPMDLMIANFHGSDDPKKMLAHLFFLLYGHSIEGKRNCYCFNAKLILSAIYYLGLKNLIELLREKFKPDQDVPPTPPKPKSKRQPPVPSPYLERSIIPVWYPASPKKFTPPPLPNLDELNEPYVDNDEYRIRVKPPPPPPPPPPPKRIPRAICDKLAGVFNIAPSQVTTVTMKTTMSQRKHQNHNMTLEVKKKTYGICITRPERKSCRRKLKPPTTGVNNAQYLIQGVYTVGRRTVFVLGSVSILPAEGDLIHGGFAQCPTGYMNIHLGFRGYPAPPPPDPCDCNKKWQDKILKYVKESKCYCGHNYDYSNEGTFPSDELPHFQKPTAGAPYQFNYHTIFDIDEKQLLIKKEVKKILEGDSVIGSKKDLVVKKKEKEKKRSSKTCLGQNPKPSQYLKCALRVLRGVNVAARLPDVHLAPELVEWMRRRIAGPLGPAQRQAYLRQTRELQTMLDSITPRIYGPLLTKNNTEFRGASTWTHKLKFRDRFNKYSCEYRRQLFKCFANINNLLWRIMFLPEFPDKKFREIFFSYLYATSDDLMLMRPYSTFETNDRKERLMSRRMICLPDGYEPPQ
ncbi:uncharacterized protein LOC134755017 [Cydia strobilella]|uniref:uncharacterized protein LOC134755017 n=1 Tax=Cydia strobilella TaxID=1100964 RepID=UPI003005340B